jgi:hypothetical protein
MYRFDFKAVIPAFHRSIVVTIALFARYDHFWCVDLKESGITSWQRSPHINHHKGNAAMTNSNVIILNQPVLAPIENCPSVPIEN